MLKSLLKILKPPGRKNQNDYILTGLPRAGTTLACKILSEQANVIALNEPIQWKGMTSTHDGLTLTRHAFTSFRNSLLLNGTAPSRVRDGQLTDNHFARNQGERQRVISREVIQFDKTLDHDFMLFIKHNSIFTLLLQQLSSEYKCYAIIRNPLAVLGSWNSVDVPVSRGMMRHLEILNPDLQKNINALNTLAERQMAILDFYFKQYLSLPSENIFRYEDIIDSQARELERIIQSPIISSEPLFSQNISTVYQRDKILSMGEALLKSDLSYRPFYTQESIEQLLAAYELQ